MTRWDSATTPSIHRSTTAVPAASAHSEVGTGGGGGRSIKIIIIKQIIIEIII